jgi:type IV pilus assembly protein PilY1
MNRTVFRTAVVALVVGLAGISSDHAQTCTTDTAPRNLIATSLLDTFVNPPDREDQGFIERSAGIPNIFILFSNASSMRRLPPDGPASYGTLPPLNDAQCTGTGDAADPVCANKLLPAHDADCPTGIGCPVMGCGLDPVSQPYTGAGTAIGYLSGVMYQPPCGMALSGDATRGKTYQQAYQSVGVVDYAHEASVCRYFVPTTNGTATGKDGYDPDHYCGSSGDVTACGGDPNFFDKDLVFHDAIADATPTGLPGDGWTDTATTPWLAGGKSPSGVTDFCTAQYGTAHQGSRTKADICTQCLTERGFLLDGRLLRKATTASSSGPGAPYPSIWLTGNFLNLYPPKFIVARKVMKDVISDLRDIRMGFAQFGATGADHTPNAWQALNPSCGMVDSSNFSANRGAYISQLDKVTFTARTPLARALLDVGQYYHSPSLEWFDTTTSSLGTTWNSPSNANQLSICYACQISSVIAITDGIPGPDEGNELPLGSVTAAQVDTLMAGSSQTGIKPTVSGAGRTGGIPTSLCPKCEAFPATEDWKNNPARVAWYLHNLDLRSTGETTEDCMGMGGKQTLNVYTVGFGTGNISGANTLLTNTATMGGGFFTGAETPTGLRDAITNILSQIVERSTSFSVATVSTLQTTTGHSVIVPRFDPDKDSMRWKGHLSRYELYSEFLNTCTETLDGSGAGDLDCDGKCASVFLTDSTGAFISEDSDGIFRKNEPNAPYCIQAPLCAARGKICGMPGTTPASSWWDAATLLDATAWRSRIVYSVVDDKGASNAPDGAIDGRDTVFRLEATDTVAAAITPYLGDTATLCSDTADLIATAGDGDTAALVRSDTRFCVKQIIRFLLGADVFNEQVLPADMWRRAATDEGQNGLPDRAFKLGDIFHSSPVVMDPPPPANGILCPNGLHNQCLTSLWQTPILHATTAANGMLNAYQAYAEAPVYRDRRKVILVGANDGFLHAMDGGRWHGNPNSDHSHNADADDPLTTALDESLPPFNGFYDRGTGDELWAFLPPDMLGKVRLYLRPLRHQLFVDGSPMVRDVWVDGTTNLIESGTVVGTVDGKKQSREFHTVAVVGERRGGTRYFALDVSDATRFAAEQGGTPTPPKFLWIYPQPGDPETVTSAETYTDFLPVGPPIGPVRIEAAANPGVTPTMTIAGETPVPYRELWVAFLSGGFDPMYLRGRGVHMVDVWTGKEIFDFSYPDVSAPIAADNPRLQLKYPVAATVGMVMWGQNERRLRSFENDGYFDTATFGDTGGQLWALRFSRPGRLDPNTQKVTNWFGGRIMSIPDCASQPFFYITGNVAVRQGYYRVVAGTGDRFNLLDTNGGQCDPDNPRACAQRGCTVTMTSGSNLTYAAGAGGVSRAMTVTGGTCAVTTSSAAATAAVCTAGGSASMQISCPGGGGTATKTVTLGCTLGATGYLCTPSAPAVGTVAPTTAITHGNWYMSLRVFDSSDDRGVFSDEDGAKTYDQHRLKVSSATGVTSSGIITIDGADGATLPNPLSTYDGKGWALWYDHNGQVTVADHTYNVNRVDERTSSTSAVYGGVYWNTTQPTLGSVTRVANNSCPKSSKCIAEGRRVTYHYGANVESGGPVLLDDAGQLIRSVKNVTLVPAMGDQPTVFVNQKGQIQVGLAAVNPERGATNVFAGEGLDPLSEYGTVEVSRDAHACRHAATQAEAAMSCP